MKSIKVCEYSRSKSFHDDLILQGQASGERSQDQWSSGYLLFMKKEEKKITINKAVETKLSQQIFTRANKLPS